MGIYCNAFIYDPMCSNSTSKWPFSLGKTFSGGKDKFKQVLIKEKFKLLAESRLLVNAGAIGNPETDQGRSVEQAQFNVRQKKLHPNHQG